MWIHRIRLKALAWIVAIGLFALGAISIFAAPAWPVVGVAVAAVAVALNQISHRLSHATCYGCGEDLRGQAPGQYGVVCRTCGVINQISSPNLPGADDPRHASGPAGGTSDSAEPHTRRDHLA